MLSRSASFHISTMSIDVWFFSLASQVTLHVEIEIVHVD